MNTYQITEYVRYELAAREIALSKPQREQLVSEVLDALSVCESEVLRKLGIYLDKIKDGKSIRLDENDE